MDGVMIGLGSVAGALLLVAAIVYRNFVRYSCARCHRPFGVGEQLTDSGRRLRPYRHLYYQCPGIDRAALKRGH